jgi:hypothetical protein
MVFRVWLVGKAIRIYKIGGMVKAYYYLWFFLEADSRREKALIQCIAAEEQSVEWESVEGAKGKEF